MTKGVGPKFRPHELRNKDAEDRAKRAEGPKVEDPRAEKIVRDVLALTHGVGGDEEKVRFAAGEAKAALESAGKVALRNGELHLGGQRFAVTAAQAEKLTLLGPTAQVLAAVHSGLSSKEPTVISAATGSGAAYAARWLLDAVGARHEVVRLSPSTALDTLVGGLRPDEKGKLRVQDGPLARCIRGGGVFVLDGLEKADPQVMAALKALARGAQRFHHPVSGEPVPVHSEFRLVLIADQSQRLPRALTEVCSWVEVGAYGEADHRRLLTERHRLPARLATQVAQLHEAIARENQGGELDFGRGFPLTWDLLDKVGARLAKLAEPTPALVAQAFLGVYGARLPREDQREVLRGLLEKQQFATEYEAPRKSKDPSFVHTPRIDQALVHAEAALEAGETLLLHAHGQSGATRLVEELGRRRKQELVTVVGHSGSDAQSLMEAPVFTEDGALQLRPGRVAKALLEGKLLYVDHLDQMSKEQQHAFFQLQHAETIRIVDKGKVVERPIHKDARVVLSTTEGKVRGRTRPSPAERATVTEVHLDRPKLDELLAFLPKEVTGNLELKQLVVQTLEGLEAEQSAGEIKKLQRVVDFARASALLAEHLDASEAVARAAKLVFAPKKSAVLDRLEHQAKGGGNLWMKLLDLSPNEVEQRLAKTGYRVTESMEPHLEALAVAYRLGRSVRAVGPASAGKTVLGAVMAALLDKKNVRVNFSQSTESRDLMGGLGPVNVDGRTLFKHVEGPAFKAAELNAVITADEWNLSRQGQMAVKAALDHRARLIDPEADLERPFGATFFYAAQNENDPRTGRFEPPPEVQDAMFTIWVGAKPTDEKVEIVASQCGLDRGSVEKIAEFFGDLELLVKKGRLESGVGPITCTERDMLKAARTVEHLFKRDAVVDPKERDALLGREVYRQLRDALLDPKEHATVLELAKKHFGKRIEVPTAPTAIERVKVKVDGKNVEMLQIGVARFPIRPRGEDAALDALVPNLEGVKAPVGPQLEFLESALLALELGQPLAVVGNTGTGKTMLMRFLASQLNFPTKEQPYHADMTEEHLFGTTVVTPDGKVEFRYAPLPECIKQGLLYIGDEPTTLGNDVRESLNPVTERSEIQIAQKRPPESILAKDWSPNFRFVVTTNGDDIREDGFSEAEASRFRLLGLREIDSVTDFEAIAQRDYVGKGLNKAEVERATELFVALRELQKGAKDAGLSPLTPRIFSSFMDLAALLRNKKRPEPEAVLRAAELTLWPKLGAGLAKKAMAEFEERYEKRNDEVERQVPEAGEHGVRFGDTEVSYGGLRPWKASNERFPMTPARLRNLELVADAVVMGQGRPVSLVDDENGEAVDTLREFGRLTGRQVTVVSLPPNVDLESMIERLQLSDDAAAKGGFEPVLMQIGQAVREGHVLVLRGAGNVPSTKLERLNSLGDGRMGLKLPLSGDWLKAAPNFRMVLMRSADAAHRYSAALENRLISPPLSTQEAATTQAALENRAAELAAAVRERTGISADAANTLGAFHTYLNQLLRDGKFASGKSVGAFLNRDAESVARRLAWLTERGVVDDPAEMLLHLVNEVYGSRLPAEQDRQQLLERAKKAFGAEGGRVQLDDEVHPGPQLSRVGEWVLARDPKGTRDGVPQAESVLPPTNTLGHVVGQLAAATQFEEVVHLSGPEVVADAAVRTLARLTSSPVVEIEGNEELSEAFLFGGLVQNPETGQFEQHEGAIFEAQASGATVVLKNASSLPPDVMTRLVEIAATGHISRVVNGKLETQPRAFRLVLETFDGDAPLPRELASVATRVRCPEVTDRDDFVALLGHQLLGVPGSKDVAAQLHAFSQSAAQLLEEQTPGRRQDIRFDGARAFRAAQQIARRVTKEGWPLERALADVLDRAYLRPASGTEIEADLADSARALVDQLAGWLVLEPANPVDLVEQPEVEALQRDYAQVAPRLLSELLRGGADALRSGGKKEQSLEVLTALIDSGVLPGKVLATLTRAKDQLQQQGLTEADRERLATSLDRAAAEEAPLKEPLLAFVRGARVWDLDLRLGILDRFQTVFEALSKSKSPLVTARISDLLEVKERFDAAGASAQIGKARAAVTGAIARYERRAGEADDELRQTYKRLLSTWDLVSTSPIFREHVLPELAELERSLAQLEAAHRVRGEASDEVVSLCDALRDAAQALEGVRIAEQSAELRRGMKRVTETAEALVGTLREEIGTIRTLEAARKKHEALEATKTLVQRVLGEDRFLRLNVANEGVERPASTSEAELLLQAERLAARDAEADLAIKKEALYAQLHQAGAQGPKAADMWRGYDLGSADVGLKAELAAPPVTRVEQLYVEGVAALQAEHLANQKRLTTKHLGELKAGDERRVQGLYEQRVKQRAQEVAARVNQSASELSGDLGKVAVLLNLREEAPELYQAVRDAQEALDRAGRDARNWAGAMGNWVGKAARGLFDFATFNLFGLAKVGAQNDLPKAIDLAQAKAQATAVMQQVQRFIATESKLLPNFEVVGVHRAASERATEGLLSASNLGDLSAKYVRLAEIQELEGDADVRRTLTAVMGRLAGDRELRGLLGAVAAFCESADLLSAEAKQGVIAIELAPAVDAVMRTAETVRTQPLSDGAYKSAVRALQRGLERMAEVKGANAFPALLEAVEAEMRGLLEKIEALVQGRGGQVKLETAAFRDMLRSLGQTEDAPRVAPEIVAAVAAVEVTPASASASDFEVCLTGLRQREQERAARPARSTRLVTLELDFGRAGALAVAAGKAEEKEDVTPELSAQRERLLAMARAWEEQGAVLAGELGAVRKRSTELLGALDRSVAHSGLLGWRQFLEGLSGQAGELLDLAAAGGRGLARQTRQVLDGLRQAASGLRSMEGVPESVAAPLVAAVEEARAVESAFSSERFQEAVRNWAARTLAAVAAASGDLGERAAKAEEDGRERPAVLVAALDEALDRLGEANARLGSWSRFSLLSHVRERLAGLAPGLDPEARIAAQDLRTKIEARASTLIALAEGPEGERTAADLYEGFLDLTASLHGKKKLTDETVERLSHLGELIWSLVGPVPLDTEAELARLGQAIEISEKVATLPGGAPARELSLSLGDLRQRIIAAAGGELVSAARREVADHLEGVRGARLALQEQARAFVEYDPLARDVSLAELGRGLRRALTDIEAAMVGPGAALLSQDVLALAESLERSVEGGGPAGAEANKLLAEMDPLLRNSKFLAELPDVQGRFTRMVHWFDQQLGVKDSKLVRERLPWGKEALAALGTLMKADRVGLGDALEAAEAHFAHLLPKPKQEEPAEKVGQSQVKKLLEKQPAAVRLDLGGVRGLHADAPPELDQVGEVDIEGAAQPRGGRVGREGKLEVKRNPLAAGQVTERSDKLDVVELSSAGLRSIQKKMNEVAETQAVHEAADILTEFDKFIEDNMDMVEQMAAALRQHPGLETVVVLDQSGSTSDLYGDSRIIDQERAALAIIMAAHMRAERNCAVVGFGGANVGHGEPLMNLGGRIRGGTYAWVHKPMTERLDAATANFVYGIAGNSGGGTDLIQPINVALGQFTARANNKLVHVLTDAQLGNADDVRRYIDNARANGVGIAVQGFGDAQHVRQVAGDYGQHVASFSEAVRGAAELFMKTVVANAGRFQGKVDGAAQGIGVAHGQAPLSAAPSDGPMAAALSISKQVDIPGDPPEAFEGRGLRREQINLADRGIYERTLKELEARQRQVERTPAWRQCLTEVRALRGRHEREGITDALRDSIAQGLPKTRGVEWERKQLAGPLFDEQQLPMYVAGLAQGVPVMRIFKRRKPKEDTKATVVLAIDESSSMGDSDKMRAHLEALFAYGDALKSADPEVRIAVVGFSDKVRLHAGFEQEWSDELKAHLLHQVKGNYDATDDERGGAEAVRLLGMMDADVGQVVSFSDGQGMPGLKEVVKDAAKEGFAFLTIGVGPDSKAVARFGANGLYARNLAQLGQRLLDAQLKVWEEAGRLVQ